MRPEVLDLRLPRHGEFAGRRDDRQRRVEGLDGDIEPHLVVPLAGAAVRNGHGANLVCRVDEELRHQRPGERRGQGVGVLVHGAGGQRRKGEVAEELVPGIDDPHGHRTGGHGPAFDDRLFPAAAEIDVERHDAITAVVGKPGDGPRRIESPRIGEDERLLFRHQRALRADGLGRPSATEYRRSARHGKRHAAPGGQRCPSPRARRRA